MKRNRLDGFTPSEVELIFNALDHYADDGEVDNDEAALCETLLREFCARVGRNVAASGVLQGLREGGGE